MKLNIKKEENKIIVGFNKKIIEILTNKEEHIQNDSQWNTQNINKFLIELTSELPDNEAIEIAYDENEKNITHNHIVELFQEFSNEYNDR